MEVLRLVEAALQFFRGKRMVEGLPVVFMWSAYCDIWTASKWVSHLLFQVYGSSWMHDRLMVPKVVQDRIC